MTDKISQSARSSLMSKIKCKNTKCEIALCKALEDNGVKNFEKHYDIIGKPDIVYIQKKLAIFCDSDFWHGKKTVPETNVNYWRQKFERNKKRDRFVNRELKKLGWRVIRIRETNILKNPTNNAKKIIKILNTSNIKSRY